MDSIGKDEVSGSGYATVTFIGYGNVETVWLVDLKASEGPEAVKAQLAQCSGEAPATATATEEVVAPAATPVSWQKGDRCRADFEGVEYEATVDEVAADDAGNSYLTVTFVGYGNTATVWAADAKKSNGEEAIKKQMADSGAEVSEGLWLHNEGGISLAVGC